MVHFLRDFWVRETGTGQQVFQLRERYDDDALIFCHPPLLVFHYCLYRRSSGVEILSHTVSQFHSISLCQLFLDPLLYFLFVSLTTLVSFLDIFYNIDYDPLCFSNKQLL